MSPSSFESIIFEIKYADIQNLHFSLSKEEASVGNTTQGIQATSETSRELSCHPSPLGNFNHPSHHCAVSF